MKVPNSSVNLIPLQPFSDVQLCVKIQQDFRNKRMKKHIITQFAPQKHMPRPKIGHPLDCAKKVFRGQSPLKFDFQVNLWINEKKQKIKRSRVFRMHVCCFSEFRPKIEESLSTSELVHFDCPWQFYRNVMRNLIEYRSSTCIWSIFHWYQFGNQAQELTILAITTALWGTLNISVIPWTNHHSFWVNHWGWNVEDSSIAQNHPQVDSSYESSSIWNSWNFSNVQKKKDSFGEGNWPTPTFVGTLAGAE